MNDIMDIVEEINRILRERQIPSHDVTGYDEAEQRDWYYFDMEIHCRKIGIEICRECTIFLEDLNGH